MVLLTSSTISVAISSSIICMFTFLLFLSGYVMQQQTVRSLQDALHAPPVPKPTPTLPPQFRKQAVEGLDTVVEIAAVATEGIGSELQEGNAGSTDGAGTETVAATLPNLDSAEG